MIFYYSATGNSQWITQQLALLLDEQVISVTDELKAGASLQYQVPANEPIGFIFPVHAWNPPYTLLDFIKRVQFTGICDSYLYAIATCGDSSGHTMRVFQKACKKRGWELSANWELQMPNNYLPLQDVDSPEREKEKLDAAAGWMGQIHNSIVNRNLDSKQMDDKFPGFKTYFIGFFFHIFGKSSHRFYVTDACTGCGMCQNICLKNTITMQDKQPRWGKNCDQCYACINRCPHQAIQYGKKTKTRGRYCHPSIRCATAQKGE